MATSWTEIIDINGNKRKYDLGSGIEIIDTTTPKVPDISTTTGNIPTSNVNNTKVDDSAWTKKPYENMTPAEQTTALKIAEDYNKVLEQSANDVNIAKYGATAEFKYPPAATIWNPTTGKKKAVRLDRVTGKIWQEDLDNLPDDFVTAKGGQWTLWTGGMVSGAGAVADKTISPVVAPITPPAVVTPAPVGSIVNPAKPNTSIVAEKPKATVYAADGSYKIINVGDPIPAGYSLTKPVAPGAAQIVVPAGAVYLPDTTQLAKLGSTRVIKDSTGKLYALPNKLQYISTIAEMQKIPEAQRVIISGRWYKLI
jgi:hypothetical protein